MRVSCLQENLARGLSVVGRAVATRSTLPVLSNVLLATDEGRLRLSATNLEIGINCWIGAKVEEEGAVTVPARLLTELVSSLPPERIDLELVVRTRRLHLRCGRFEAEINTIDASEFPIIPTSAEDYKVALNPVTLHQMIGQVVFAAAVDEARPVLTGVFTHFEDSRLTMAAADGFRLSVRTAELPAPVPESIGVIVPARALAELARIAPKEEEEAIEVSITPSRSQILFQMKDATLVSQLIEGNFPDYKAIIPKTYNTRTVVSTADFLKAVRIAFLFAREASNIVRLQIMPGTELAPGHMTVAATSAELGENIGEIEASIEGEPIEIAFNARYLIEVLSVIPTAQVALETTTPTSPGVIRPVGEEDFTHVIMPMHLA